MTRQRELIEWYGIVAGLTVTFEFPMGAWLTNDAANHRLALLSFPEVTDDPDKRAHTGIDHTAFEYGSFDELMDSYARLKDLGILPRMCLDHGMTLSLYYHDPDGNAVELQVDNFGSWEQSKHYMQTSPEFAENPLGTSSTPTRSWRHATPGCPSARSARARSPIATDLILCRICRSSCRPACERATPRASRPGHETHTSCLPIGRQAAR